MDQISEYLNIVIDYSRDELLSEFSKKLLKKHYLVADETSPQQALARASVAYCNGDYGLAQRIYDYVSKKWFMFASPVLSNASCDYWKSKGLPISCFLGYVPDTREGLIEHSSETKYLSTAGGGVGGHWSDVRSISDVAPSPIPFLAEMDRTMLAWKQGKTRKGSYAAYMDVSHPDIIEFLQLRVPTGGDPQRKSFNLNNAVNITDKFLEAVKNEESWDLIDPNDQSIRDTIKAKDLWHRILETRFRTGEPYICYVDEANRQLPATLKRKQLSIHGSNLCTEIFLPTNDKRTAVCCLSSLNLEYFEEWKGTSIVKDLVTFLNNVLDNFIENAPDILHKARYSAQRERSIGLGTMGLHSYFRRKNIPFESVIAKSTNMNIFKHIEEEAKYQSALLAQQDGCYPDGGEFVKVLLDKEYPTKEFDSTITADKYSRKRHEYKLSLIKKIGRNAHLIAIAPNANSGVILDTSPSIEPLAGNIYSQKTRVGTHMVKCKYLDKLIKQKLRLELYDTDNYTNCEDEKNSMSYKNEKYEELWDDINAHKGSIQHLEFFSDQEKLVFKTAYEIDQRWVIDLARDRQRFIDQGQSVNLFFCSGAPRKYVKMVHERAFRRSTPEDTGVPLKSLYYLRAESSRYVESISKEIERIALKDGDDSSCLSCEG